MKTSLAYKLAAEFVNVLKYNPELTHDEKILSLESRLEKLISDVETSCAEAQKRHENDKVIVDERPRDIPQIAELMLMDQKLRGLAN